MSAPLEAAQPATDTMTLVGVGRLLTQAREQAGLSREEAAARLRLSARQIEALEAGNPEALPGPTFVRGFIRNYARLLEIDAQPLLESLRDVAPDGGGSHISLQTENIPIDGDEPTPWRAYLLIGVVLLLLLAAWMWFMDDGGERLAPTPAEVPAQPLENGETALPLQPLPPAPEAVPTLPAGPVPEAQPAAELPVPQPARLQFSCTQPGWVSVRDRDDKEVLNATLPAGGSRVVEGMPPFKIVLGNAIGMQVTYNDVPVDLAMHTRGGVARFTLE